MYIHELLNNPEFNFNAPVRILKYLGGDETVTDIDADGDPVCVARHGIEQEFFVCDCRRTEYDAVDSCGDIALDHFHAAHSPADLAEESASGLDPDYSVEVGRFAAARAFEVDDVDMAHAF